MSGRGLGHTGGTIDKLESIPGFNVNLTEQEFLNQINTINVAITSQTKDIAVADKNICPKRCNCYCRINSSNCFLNNE